MLIGIDGPPEVQDSLRPLKGGRPSYVKMANNIRALSDSRGGHLSARVTVCREFIASAPRSWRIQARRLAVCGLASLGLSVVLGVMWSRAAGLSLPAATAISLGPMLMLGALAYATSVVTSSATTAIAAALTVWAVEQSHAVTRVFQGPLQHLYLYPLSATGVRDVVGYKLGIAVAALALLALSVWAREMPSRWLDR